MGVCRVNQALADVWLTGAGIKCLYCTFASALHTWSDNYGRNSSNTIILFHVIMIILCAGSYDYAPGANRTNICNPPFFMVLIPINPSNAEATFVQSTRAQRFLKTI